VPPGKALAIGAGEVDVGGDPVVRPGAVAALEQQPGGHPGGRVEEDGEPPERHALQHAASRGQAAAGQGGGRGR